MKVGNGNAIVMIDDSASDLLVAEMCLERSSIANELVQFTDAAAFTDYLDEIKRGAIPMPAYVLIDVSMPEVPGFDLLEKVRADPFFHKLPIIAMFTNTDHESDRLRAQQAGADEFLIKPAGVDDYIEFFERLKRLPR